MPRNSIFDAQIQGGEAVTAEIQRLQVAVSPQGRRNSLLLLLGRLQRYALGIVHVDTGRLKNSIFTEVSDSAGYVATNVEYAAAEEGRGGSHAFFGRTVREEGPDAVRNTVFNPIVRGR